MTGLVLCPIAPWDCFLFLGGGGGLGGDSEPLGSKFQIFYDFIVSQCQKNDQKASESCH